MNALVTQANQTRGCGCRNSTEGGRGGACGCTCDSTCCELECLVRPNFFCGQVLTDADLAAMVEWTRQRLALQRYRDGWGVACGLELSCNGPDGQRGCCGSASGGPAVYVDRGYAVDCCGNDLVVCEPIRVDLSSVCTTPDDPCLTTAAAPAAAMGNDAEGLHTWPIPQETASGCLSLDTADLFAVQLRLGYHEDLSHGQRAVLRQGCSDNGPCAYARVLESPRVFIESTALALGDPDAGAQAAWERELRSGLAQDRARIGALMTQDQSMDAVAQFLQRDPPHRLCFLPDVVCCLRDHLAHWRESEALTLVAQAEFTRIGVYLLLERLLRRVRCACAVCPPEPGVAIGRVVLRRSVVDGKTRCTVVSVDAGSSNRRLLRKDTCRPIAERWVDLLPFVWQTADEALPRLRAQQVRVSEMPMNLAAGLDEPLDRILNQPQSFDLAGGDQLVALTVPDPFQQRRIAAFVPAV